MKYARWSPPARRDHHPAGRTGPAIFVVRDGYAKMVSSSEDGHDVLVGIVGPGDAFGHAAMAEISATTW